MGTDVSEVTESLPAPRVIKVHQLMCTELITLVSRVSNILPEIEAFRPCSSGIKALCLLNEAIVKAKSLLRSCSESSKLYLALTGDAILSRCIKSKNLLEQSLGELQTMVPVLLAAKIYQMVSDLRNSALCLDPSEEEAGKVLRNLLHQYSSATDSIEETAFEAILVAAQRLGITSLKTLRIEQRSIKKLLHEVGENDPRKKTILLFFLYLLSKYGELIVEKQIVQEEPYPLSSSYHQSVKVESRLFGGQEDAQMNMSDAAAVPEQYICPLALRLMYDPVIIASGVTFERMWIQKWFDEGQHTCPKTTKMLPHLSVTPNTALKELITKWRTENKANIPDPSLPVVFHQLETSSCSIASLSSSLNDLSLPIDFSNISTGSSNARQDPGSSYPTIISNGLNMMSTDSEVLHSGQVNAKANERDMQILFELDTLPWGLRSKVIQDIKISENYEHQTCNSTSCGNLLQIILNFLKEAQDLHDVEAQKSGCVFLLSFLKNCSSCILYLEEETYRLLVSFLDTEAVEETLGVLEVLSRNGLCNDNFTTPGALSSILRMLDKEIARLQELALRILFNLSENSKIMSIMVVSDIVPKLIAFLEDSALASYSIAILEKFCYKEDARDFVAETEGCISSIIKLLESVSHDDQEHAVAVLLSLCSQRVQYCQLVMDEGVIPFLVNVSNRGNNRTNAMATELRRLLRDEVDYNEECHEFENLKNPCNNSKGRKSFPKRAWIFRKVSKLF